MKKGLLCFFFALFCMLLSACAAAEPAQQVLVSLTETGEFTAEENGIQVFPGQKARFILHMKSGMELSGTDYDGTYRIWKENDTTILELLDVRYPTRVSLSITSHFRRITYLPNGAEGDGKTITYDTTVHTRPNTSIGTDLFTRDGYTLTSWNTEPDGSGLQVGLGSRVTVTEDELVLYAVWAKWNSAEDFVYAVGNGITIERYLGTDQNVVIPESIAGMPVTTIAEGAFSDTAVRSVILPKSLRCVEDGAFSGCAVESLLLFDNIESISDASFSNCGNLQTLYINAIEAPYGYLYRRESVYADKVDLLINAQGQKKLVFYGGCSMWYNLNGQTVQTAFDNQYAVINMGLNGTINSYVQMAILEAFLEEGDIFFHTPELSSEQQLLLSCDMGSHDKKLWCGLENNYDLFTLVDIRGIGGVFDSLCSYLSIKKEAADYRQQYMDQDGNLYMDSTGGIPFSRTETAAQLEDRVSLDPAALAGADLSALTAFYQSYSAKGVRVYVSYACVDMDALAEGEQQNIGEMDKLFHGMIDKTDCAVLVSILWNYLYEDGDFYDTVYHMRSDAADRNTATWLRDLKAQMKQEGLW